MKEMVFWGATGQAKVLRECMKHSRLKLVALFDNNHHVVPPFTDVPLYFGKKSFEDWIQKRRSENAVGFLIAIGGNKGKDRVEMQEYLEAYGLIPLIAKHPTSYVANNTKIGAGSQLLAHSSVCVETVIGRGCIINTNASVDHECYLNDGVHIGPGANLGGGIEVGCYATISIGAVVLPRIKIGEGAVVGAGAVVIKDVSPYTTVVGNPAMILEKQENEK